jgi:NADH-quinone oxidoreductase subunit L
MINPLFILLVPMLPFAGFVMLGLFGRKYFKETSGIIATGLLLGSTAFSIYIAWQYFSAGNPGAYPHTVAFSYTWLRFSENLSIDMGAMVDPIAVMMMVVVSFVSLMVHVYSLAYLKGEERFSTYFSYLSLFTFSMLGLVMSSNLFQIYIFWELVGVSSFLLIGFYYEKPSAVAACKKAFIVTRFADLGFLIGILILSFNAGTLDFNTLITNLTTTGSSQVKTAMASTFLGTSALTWGMALIFIGGAGKSAMMPLHIWLPDAMEGPTPVSALIHAATMVVAGVFLVARLFPVFSIATPAVLEIIGWVGAISAIFAAVIACTQTDIKRVLAYSTLSQIGFMMFALGVSKYGRGQDLGFTASMFHLFTHAMFKALLFLGAGAVIHYVHSNEMKDMGGLRKQMPITHITFLMACLAIAGVPPFAGFFSKEEILLAAFNGNRAIYYIALVTSGLTAFYMFRLYFSIFWSKKAPSHSESAGSDVHGHGEGGFAMMLPLVLLALGAAFAGFIPFGNFISADGTKQESNFHLMFSIAPVAIGLTGIILAFWLYKKENTRPAKMAASLGSFYKAVYNKFYFDELYLFVTKKVLFNLIGRPAAWFDKNVVDGLVNATGNTTEAISDKIKGLQSGKVQQYAAYFFAGVFALVLLFIYVWK